MKFSTSTLSILGLILLALIMLSGCTSSAPTQTTPVPATPIPPKYLDHLPTFGRVECDHELSYYGLATVTLWELPGLSKNPDTCDSDCFYSIKGESKGSATHCTIVEITDFAWSEWDQTFYLFVRYRGPIPVPLCKGTGKFDICDITVEYQQREGWVDSNFIEVPHLTETPTPSLPKPTRTPAQPLALPTYLSALPVNGKIRCDIDPNVRDDPAFPDMVWSSTIQLWETPIPTISENETLGPGYQTISKQEGKLITFCDRVLIQDYIWSPWDGTYYLLVWDEKDQYGGWIKQEYVEFPLPSPSGTKTK